MQSVTGTDKGVRLRRAVGRQAHGEGIAAYLNGHRQGRDAEAIKNAAGEDGGEIPLCEQRAVLWGLARPAYHRAVGDIRRIGLTPAEEKRLGPVPVRQENVARGLVACGYLCHFLCRRYFCLISMVLCVFPPES